jgi:malate dehydrogenase
MKAVVLGASGGIGQPLSLLLKQSTALTDLSLYDVVNTPGVAADLSHIPTPSKVTGHLPANGGLEKALTGADLVVIPAGLPRKPGMTRDDLFNKNASIVRDLITGIAKCCPKAFVLIISNPVNSTVPIAAEILKKHNVFDPKKLFGVTTLDVVRAQTFVAEAAGIKNPLELKVPIIGGHSGETIVPILSQTTPSVKLSKDQIEALTKRIQFGGDEVVKAKDGAGSATVSMAYAGFRFASAVIDALSGKTGIEEPSFVYLPGVPGGKEILPTVGGTEFFAVRVQLGKEGVVKANGYGKLDAFEEGLLKAAIEGLKGNITKGVEFVTKESK